MQRPMTASDISSILPRFTVQTIENHWSHLPSGRHSAVLLLFLADGSSDLASEAPSVLLTKRSYRVKTHKGQVGFPGGRAEPGDTGPAETALREAQEEVGLPPESVHILGRSEMIQGLDKSLIIPVVGFTEYPSSALQPNEEVASIFTAPWQVFKHGNERSLAFKLFGKSRETYYFLHQGYRIWGLTAAMLVSAKFQEKNEHLLSF